MKKGKSLLQESYSKSDALNVGLLDILGPERGVECLPEQMKCSSEDLQKQLLFC